MFANGDFTFGWRILLVLLCSLFGTQALCAPSELKIENELLLELRLDGKKIGRDILGYQRGNQFLLSLEELTTALGFPITVDASQGLASGWYISENRDFSLNLARSEVISDGNKLSIVDGDVVIFEGDLYVETESIETWFPLQLSADVRNLYLDVEPLVLLPMQLRSNRRNLMTPITTGIQEPQHPLQKTPYQFFGPHITKLTSTYTTARNTPDSDATYNVNYATLSRGDLGWMTSTLAFAGQSEDTLTAARLKLERTGFDGPMGLNNFEMGDIGGFGFRLRGSSGGEKAGRFDSESISLEGSQLPDWDVELYQNDQLVTIQATGSDGSYVFENVPLVFGQNHFELKFFGPNGETESREEFHFLGEGMHKVGSMSYQTSATQSGRSVFGLRDTEQSSRQYSNSVNFGLSRNLTLGAGVTSSEDSGGSGEFRHTSNVGIGLSASRFYTSAEYVNSPDTQNSLSTSLRTRLGLTDLSLNYTRFFDAPDLNIIPRNWTANLQLASSIFTLPIKLQATTTDSESVAAYGLAMSTTLPLSGAGKLSSSLTYGSAEQYLGDSSVRTSSASGNTSFHTSIRPWFARVSASYTIEPEFQLQELAFNSRLSIDQGLSMSLDVRQSQTRGSREYRTGINWRLDQLAINASVTFDSNDSWSGRINLSTTLFNQPGTLMPRLDSRGSVNSGVVEVRVFEDVVESKREAQPGVRVKGVQAWRRETTNARGVAYLSGLPSHRQIDIELDESTLSEYELRSINPGVSVVGRPGSYAVVEFPILRTAELEGHVVTADGEESPVSRAVVTLKTPVGEVVAQTRTAFDGFFLFEGVEPGTYQVSLDERISHRIRSKPGSVTVLGSSGVITALDFSLHPEEEDAKAKRTLVLQEESSQQSEPESSYSIPVLLARPLPEEENPAELPVLASALPESESQAKPQPVEGTWFVQIGAYGSRELAEASWGRTSQSLQVLQGKAPRFVQYQNMTRLLVGPGRSRDAAKELCQQLKASSVDCLVRSVEQ